MATKLHDCCSLHYNSCRLIDRLASGETIEDEERDEQGQTALHRAASAGDTAKV